MIEDYLIKLSRIQSRLGETTCIEKLNRQKETLSPEMQQALKRAEGAPMPSASSSPRKRSRRKGTGEGLSANVAVSLTPVLKAEIEQSAAAEDISVSEWMRRAAEVFLASEKKKP